jgi:serine phosphatase RsbU (regulator of sigma subunit)
VRLRCPEGASRPTRYMTTLDPHTTLKRALLGILLLFLLSVAAVTLSNFASSTTDENLFVTSISKVSLTRDIPAEWKQQLKVDRLEFPLSGKTDMVRVGDLVFGISGKEVQSLAEARTALEGVSQDSAMTMLVLDPRTRTASAFRIQRRELTEGTLNEIPSSVLVTDVTPGGASDRAGMIVGDLIVRINGEGFATDQQADQILRRAQSGKTINYDIYRDGVPMTLHVTLARYGFPLWVLMSSLTGMVYFFFGAFVVLKRPNIKAALLVGLCFVLIGFFITGYFARRDVDTWFRLLRDALGIGSLFFGWAFGIHSSAYFPKERTELISRRSIWWCTYGLATFATVCIFVLGDMLLFAAAIVMVIYPAVLYFLFRKQITLEYRRLNRVIKVASVIVAGVSLAIFVVLRFAKMSLDFRLIVVLLIAFPLAYLYTIGRYRLLDMNLRIRRNLQYSLVSIGWGIIAALLFMAVLSFVLQVDLPIPVVIITGTTIEVTDTPATPELRETVRRALAVVFGIGAWYAVWRIRRRVQQFIDEKYYRTHYDYRRASEELAEAMATNLSMVDLARGIVAKLSSLMQVKRAGILFFRDEAVCCCQEGSGIATAEWGQFCLATGTALGQAIKKFKGEFRVDYLPDAIKEIFRRHEFHYLVPIRSKDRLIGSIVLGEKLSEATFSDEDLSFLSAVAKQASVAIENAFLYEELAEKERLKHELQIARRIQLASLPQSTPDVPGLDIAGLSVPALEVGGDFFDYLNGTPDKLTVIVGDVSGKGTSAALYMSKVQGILRSLHGFDLSPGDLFVRANRLLCNDLEKKSFITAFGAAFESSRQKAVLARAGHLPLFRYLAATRGVEKLTPRGLGLGLDNSGLFTQELEEQTVEYRRGDVLLFVTDGVTEARNPQGEEFGEDRLMRIVETNADLSASDLRDRIFSTLQLYCGDQPQLDDQTIVVVRAV